MTIRPPSNAFSTTPQKTQTAFGKQISLADVTQRQQLTARELVDGVRDWLLSLTEEHNQSHLGERGLKQLKDRLEILHQGVDKLKEEVADRQLGRELTALQGDLGHLRFTVDHDRVELLDERLDSLSQELVYGGAAKKQFVKDRLAFLRKDVDKRKEELGGGEPGPKLTEIHLGISALGHVADDQLVLDDAERGWQMLTRLSADVVDHLRNVAKDPTRAASPDDFDVSFSIMHLWIAGFEERIASDITTKFNHERTARSVSSGVTRPFHQALSELRTEMTNYLKKR